MVVISYLVNHDTLLQNAMDIITKYDSLQNVTKVYYKMCPVFCYKIEQFHYKMRQLLKKCDGFITNCDSYYKMQCLSQNASIDTLKNYIQHFFRVGKREERTM